MDEVVGDQNRNAWKYAQKWDEYGCILWFGHFNIINKIGTIKSLELQPPGFLVFHYDMVLNIKLRKGLLSLYKITYILADQGIC